MIEIIKVSFNYKRLILPLAVIVSLTVFSFLMLKSAKNIKLDTASYALKPMPNVIIDAGHGGEDGGAVVNNVVEKDRDEKDFYGVYENGHDKLVIKEYNAAGCFEYIIIGYFNYLNRLT